MCLKLFTSKTRKGLRLRSDRQQQTINYKHSKKWQ